MTEQVGKQKRRPPTLPTAAGLDLLVRWANEGPWSLPARAEDPDTPVIGERMRVMRHLRRLTRTLGVPETLAGELSRVHDRDFGALSDGLLSELARRARLNGYVTPGCRARVPMTPVQVDGLLRLSWGGTYVSIAAGTGVGATAISGAVKRAKNDHGCVTVYQLMATAYRNHWFPDQEELRELSAGRMVWTVPGRTGLDQPPYTYAWEDDS